jgi:tubulin polyglutamylase TTLL1
MRAGAGGSSAAPPLAGRILFKTEFEKGVLISNFEKRGWERCEGDDWNFFWASKGSTRAVFNPAAPAAAAEGAAPPPRVRLNDNQLINHFPNHGELTRKDTLAKNCKR